MVVEAGAVVFPAPKGEDVCPTTGCPKVGRPNALWGAGDPNAVCPNAELAEGWEADWLNALWPNAGAGRAANGETEPNAGAV